MIRIHLLSEWMLIINDDLQQKYENRNSVNDLIFMIKHNRNIWARMLMISVGIVVFNQKY